MGMRLFYRPRHKQTKGGKRLREQNEQWWTLPCELATGFAFVMAFLVMAFSV